LSDDDFNLQNFFNIYLQKLFQKNNVSTTNQDIIKNHLTSIKLDGRSESTVKNNAHIMVFITIHAQHDIDKLTRTDIQLVQLGIDEWTCKNGRKISDSIKQQYKIGLKRFLTHYGSDNGLSEMIELAAPIKATGKAKRKIHEELLTLDEIKQLITAANNSRDRALIATMYESGARIGEHVSCRVKDVSFNEFGCTLVLPKSKTDPRKIQLVFAASYLRQWLQDHPARENRDAALWVSLKASDHPKLHSQSIGEMLTRMAMKAGIKKRIYPHLFRHSRATDLAKTWTESQLKNYLGWAPNSGMPAVYVHLSGQDMQDSVLELYGLRKKRDEHSLEICKCPRCKTLVDADAKYCITCGMPLAKDVQQTNDTVMKEIAAFINSDPQLISKLMALVQAQK